MDINGRTVLVSLATLSGAALLLVLLFFAGILVLPSGFSDSNVGTVSIDMNTNLSILVSHGDDNVMTFNLAPGIPDENGNNDAPFLVVNTGTVDLDLGGCAGILNWTGTSGGSDVNYYRTIIDNNEASSCSTIGATTWTDFNLNGYGTLPLDLCQTLQYENNQDAVNMGIKVKAPADEPDATSLRSTVFIYSAQDSGAGNQVRAAITC